MTSFMISINNHLRFNRYMVECEFDVQQGCWFYVYGFNRYMVECE